MRNGDEERVFCVEDGTSVPIAECQGFALHPSQPAPQPTPLIGA
jgi:hypothetical protein